MGPGPGLCKQPTAAAAAPGFGLLHALQVSAREHELDELKSQLRKVLAGLEDQAADDKRIMEAHTARLARESTRLEALQVGMSADEAMLLQPNILDTALLTELTFSCSSRADRTWHNHHRTQLPHCLHCA